MPRTDSWAGTELIARHQTADGALTLRVDRTMEAGEPLITMGFEESPWHFHPTEEEALAVLGEVLSDRLLILASTRNGDLYVELLDDLESAIDYKLNDSVYRFRLWSGEVSFDDIVDGRVPHTPLAQLWNWRR